MYFQDVRERKVGHDGCHGQWTVRAFDRVLGFRVGHERSVTEWAAAAEGRLKKLSMGKLFLLPMLEDRSDMFFLFLAGGG